MNKGIVIALSSIGLAQALKIPIKKYQTGKWDMRMIAASGGMPSSHSAGVSSLATYVALKRGVSTIDFALASVFGIIVMYDAQGIRRQTGEITIKVNTLDEEIEKLAGLPDGELSRFDGTALERNAWASARRSDWRSHFRSSTWSNWLFLEGKS